MGRTHSKPLAARHGRGTVCERHAMCESALMRFVVSTLSLEEAECSKPAEQHNACRILFRNCGKKLIYLCAPYNTDVWRSGGIGPRVINLWHDMDLCVVLSAQAAVTPSESALPTPAG